MSQQPWQGLRLLAAARELDPLLSGELATVERVVLGTQLRQSDQRVEPVLSVHGMPGDRRVLSLRHEPSCHAIHEGVPEHGAGNAAVGQLASLRRRQATHPFGEGLEAGFGRQSDPRAVGECGKEEQFVMQSHQVARATRWCIHEKP